MLGQHYHKIDHLAIGTEKIVSFFENKKFITLRIQGDTQKIQVFEHKNQPVKKTTLLSCPRLKITSMLYSIKTELWVMA